MEQFLHDIFEKAESETGIQSLRGRCEFISESLMESFKFQLSYKSLERYYKKETSPNVETKDILAKYLGYDNYKEYLLKDRNEELNENNGIAGNKKLPTKTIGIKRWFFIGLIPLISGAGYMGFINGKEECMLWNEDHYEISTCNGTSGEEEFREYKFDHFKKIEVTDSTNFFKNGKVQVWYDKTNGELSFFSEPGINPENGKSLRPITNYMIEKYVYSKSD